LVHIGLQPYKLLYNLQWLCRAGGNQRRLPLRFDRSQATLRLCQKALMVPVGAESVMAGRCAEKKPNHKPGFSFAGSVTTENFTSLTKV